MMVKEEDIRERYVKAGQDHVFKNIDTLSASEKNTLLEQLDSIKVEDVGTLISVAQGGDKEVEDSIISPFSGAIGMSTDEALVKTSWSTGLTSIAKGEVATLVLAGGQGTRLGFNGPKGMYNIGLPSNKSLFQIIVERIQRLRQLAATTDNGGSEPSIPFYIMTSPLNHKATVAFFEDHSFFNLNKDDVTFFEQGMLPCVYHNGKIIMESPGKVAMAPDGNGGVYPSLQSSGALADMVHRGIKYLHIFSIDNALVKPADPVFIGYCISQNADCGNKSVWKSNAHEKVGVVAEKNNKPCIVEYSEITTEMAEKCDDNTGRLLFGAGNICNHFYTIDFISNVIIPNVGNLYHIAKKKIPYYNESTKQTETPESENNGMKLETFIFDVFPLAKKMTVLEVQRNEEFAPVKNAPGSNSDSPDTARKALSELAKSWVIKAGGKLVENSDSGDSTTCEISHLRSYAGEGLESMVKDKTISCPFSL